MNWMLELSGILLICIQSVLNLWIEKSTCWSIPTSERGLARNFRVMHGLI